MSERFGFTTSWREIQADRVSRDYSRAWWFGSFDQAREQHRRACRGAWVTDVMVDPQVSELLGHDGGKKRAVARGVDLWKDDRPLLTREEFAVLWREWNDRPARTVAA